MACGFDACDHTPEFNCAYCCSDVLTCLHIDPETGRCTSFAAPCERTCSGSEGSAATIEVTYPSADALNSSGEGSWIELPGGVRFWANINGGNFAPAGIDVYEVVISWIVETDPTPNADAVRAAFDDIVTAHGYTVSVFGSGQSRYFRITIGATTPADQSGGFTFADEFDGEDPGHEERCQLPNMDVLPFDFTEETRPFIDLDADEIDDFDACTGACGDERTANLTACDTTYPECLVVDDEVLCEDYCACVVAAELDHINCVGDCRIGMVSTYLDYLQTWHIDKRSGCCRGQHSDCVKPCEQAWFDAVKTHEIDWATAQKAGEADFPFPDCSGATAQGPRRYPLTARWIEHTKNCIYPSREAVLRDARRTKQKCIATCEKADLIRRKRCDAYEYKCAADANAEYVHAASLCQSAYNTCDCTTPEADCITPFSECMATAILDGLTDQFNCCKAAHPVVKNDHDLANCKMESFANYEAKLVTCCQQMSKCLSLCFGDGELTCINDCINTANTCRAAALSDYEADLADCEAAYTGDCPNCFEPPIPLPGPASLCTATSTYNITCGPPIDGLCPGGVPCVNSMGEPCGEGYEAVCDQDCLGVSGDGANCCQYEDLSCAISTTYDCLGYTCTITRGGEACEILTDDCPSSFLDGGLPLCLPAIEALGGGIG